MAPRPMTTTGAKPFGKTVDLSIESAEHLITEWRKSNLEIVAYWSRLGIEAKDEPHE